jgi:hypothetical protein
MTSIQQLIDIKKRQIMKNTEEDAATRAAAYAALLRIIQRIWSDHLDEAGRYTHLEWTLKQCATCGREGAENGMWCDACCGGDHAEH